MLKRVVQISFLLLFVAGCSGPQSDRDTAIIEVILSSLQTDEREIRFDPRPLKPDSRIHTLTDFANVLEEFEASVSEPFLSESADQIEESRRELAYRLGIRTTDHTVDDNCAGMLKPVQPDQMEYVYADCPEAPFQSVIYSTARDVAPGWRAPDGQDPSNVRVVRGVELSLTPRGMFSRSMDYYIFLGDDRPRLIDEKRLVIME